jgi:hypothetical protein
MAVTGGANGDASGEINETVAVHILYHTPGGTPDDQRVHMW